MGIEEDLEEFVNGHLSDGNVNLQSYESIVIENKGGGKPIYEKSEDVLVIDLEELSAEPQKTILQTVERKYEESGEILREDAHEETEAIENDQSSRHVRETLQFFDGKISHYHYRMLEAALLLQRAVSRGRDLEQRRQDIYNKFGQVGININNLCNSGYFDEGGYLRDLYSQIENSEAYGVDEYREVFEEITKYTPFTVFVNTKQNAWDVATEIRDCAARQERYHVEFDFVDVRGIGSQNIETIRNAVSELNDWFGDFDYEEQIIKNEIRVRIKSDTISGLPDFD